MYVKNIESKTFVLSWVYYQNIHTIKNSSNQLKKTSRITKTDTIGVISIPLKNINNR